MQHKVDNGVAAVEVQGQTMSVFKAEMPELERRVVVLEKQVRELQRAIGKEPPPEENKEEEEYCIIS